MNYFDYVSYARERYFSIREKEVCGEHVSHADEWFARDYEESEFKRRTYESVSVDKILNGLGKTRAKYTRDIKSWKSDSDGSAMVYSVRTESIYEAYTEYRENCEW